MAQAPPEYHARVFEFGDICRILDVNQASLTTWVGFIKMLRPFGDKRGHRRVFSRHEVYVLSLFVSLYRAGIPVNQDAVTRVIAATYDEAGAVLPTDDETLLVRETEAAGINLYTARIWAHIQEKLQELKGD